MDVVVGMERPELVPAFPVPIEEPRKGGHWCLDQIIREVRRTGFSVLLLPHPRCS